MPTPDVTFEDISAAQQRIAPHIRRTPVLESELLNERSGAQLFFKCENLQEIGAFKVRGATNAVLSLTPPQLSAGVVTHSSGNHGAAVAYAARLRGVPARVVMPENSSPPKIEQVRRYGGEVLLCAPTLAAREALAMQVVADTGATFIHPYDDPRVIAGQGTVALEVLEQVPQLDYILCPVGGGGLTSGIAIAVKARQPQVRVIAVEPAGADDAFRSFESGQRAPLPQPATMADGLRATLSERTFGFIRAHVDGIVTVSEPGIAQAMRLLWQSLHVLVEPSSAVPYAALLERRLDLSGRRVAIIVTGGNVDLDALPWALAAAR